ncbi:MAG: DUF1841 family protein [Gemmatimonadaceae bacterium]
MKRYNPASAPPASEWLDLDEQERIHLIERYHKRAGTDLPNSMLHASIHAIVENQLATAIPEVVQAFERLRREGLDRHDAIHAVGSVLARQMFDLLQDPHKREDDPNPSYYSALQELTASRWQAS